MKTQTIIIGSLVVAALGVAVYFIFKKEDEKFTEPTEAQKLQYISDKIKQLVSDSLNAAKNKDFAKVSDIAKQIEDLKNQLKALNYKFENGQLIKL